MKKQLKSLLLVAIFACTTLPAWSQASTEGKDFWVANTIVCQPPSASSPAFPTIAVSAQKACTVTITDYAGNQLATANVTAGSWTRFGDNTAQIDPADYYLDPSKWYPSTYNINATDVYNHADKINNYGLHITATENVSVYVIMGTPQYSMDACNALPITALQSEYYLQDLYPYSKDVSKCVTMTTILATEDNTQVVITPKGNTYGKNNNGVPFTITLNKGQTYYLISSVNAQLAGTHIKAQGGKKIAVYVGSPNTHAPGGVSARDALFEQMMPIDYWGTQFIATRSLQKDGNIIGITATQNSTELKIDGFTQAYINEGETYYIVLQGPSDPYSKNLSKIVSPIDQVITADAAFIETSCPAAVISYDTGNNFKGEDAVTEIVNGQGDPSSVWLSPIQQKINRITFGACYTKKTKAHFLNVVTETATCANTKLTAYMGQYSNDWSDKLSWTPVPGNPTYSYARVQIGNNTETINVFTLENSKGFIAHVYGNGEDESYAYSAGSSAVEQGVNVEGETFTNGYRSESKFCFGDSLSFDAKIGTDEISRVDWTFGDGTTEYYGTPQIKHKYTTPGWYDVTAELYGHQVCTEEDNVWLGRVQFSFRVVRADTIPVAPRDSCLTIQQQEQIVAEKGQQHLDSLVTYGETTIINPDAPCYEDKLFSFVKYGLETERIFDSIVRDGAEINGRWYESDAVVTWTVEKPHKCPQHFTCNLTVITCLKIDVPNNPATQFICPGENLEIPYTRTKGHISNATFSVPGLIDKADVTFDDNANNGTFILPTSSIEKAGIYKGTLYIEDHYCDSVITVPIDFTVKYPSDIFKFKFNNVLAVYQNTGYEFTAYQWVVNDKPVLDANSSIYYLGQGNTFNEGDVVYVLLTDKDGLVLPSCPQTLTDIQDYNPEPEEPAQARKKIVDRRFVIQRGEDIYDIYGQKVK